LRRLDGGAGRETWRQQRRRRAAGGRGGVRLRAGARQRFKKNSGLSRSCARLSNPVPLFLARLKRRPPTPHDCQFVLSSRSIALSLPAPASAGLWLHRKRTNNSVLAAFPPFSPSPPSSVPSHRSANLQAPNVNAWFPARSAAAMRVMFPCSHQQITGCYRLDDKRRGSCFARARQLLALETLDTTLRGWQHACRQATKGAASFGSSNLFIP